ncbi:uncharacterized protein F5891DRAFT_1168761 [Suillus fuscotomentosus]|uniref:Uncharacterized protein n=1 Tax=Suillus fuscotomentosus TaxID=1912939 RepID=A0AAD4HWE5_9AGAM|nr:uncharacterized protein F5891DRAFT_1168761 [Suillus fuscotomentosus]KAG1908714.1 hypothetical protein F5891DRAFT_1168761 [Suillus fuscotomentosus]
MSLLERTFAAAKRRLLYRYRVGSSCAWLRCTALAMSIFREMMNFEDIGSICLLAWLAQPLALHIVLSPPYAKLKYGVSTKPENLQLQVSLQTFQKWFEILPHNRKAIFNMIDVFLAVNGPLKAFDSTDSQGWPTYWAPFAQTRGDTAVACNEEGSWCNNVCYNDLAKSMASFANHDGQLICVVLCTFLVTAIWAFKTNNANFRVFYDVPKVTEHDSSPGKVDVWNLPTETAGANIVRTLWHTDITAGIQADSGRIASFGSSVRRGYASTT